MKDIKDFQERYNRWKNGERYWDIRGVELPKYDTGKYVTVEKDDGSVYNVNPNVANSSEITVTTPEVEIVGKKPQWMIDRDDKIGQIIPTQYTLREDNTPLSSQVDKFIDKYKYKTNNVILSGLANAADDWRRDRSPLRAASRYFGWWNPIASVASATLDDKLNTRSNTPKLIIPEMIMDYGNKYGAAVRGYNHLMSKDGLEKTMRYYDILRKSNAITDPNYAGKFYDVVASGIGDVVDATLLHNATNKVINPTFNKLRNYILSSRLNNNIRRWDGTVGMEYFNSPNNWYRWTETPEIEGIREVGKNVTTRDAADINVPSNNWRTAAMDNYSKSKEGYWYKADIPDEDMPLKEYLDYLKNNTNKPIGSGRKYGSAHGNKTQASYGKAWDGSLSTSGIGQLGLLEGQVGTQIPFGKTRTSFTLTPIEEVPIGGRVGFSTGEMPMDNLGWFTKLPNGRFKYNGQVLPYKRIQISKNEGVNKSFVDNNDGLPWAYNNGQWDVPEIQKQAQKGVDDLRAWVTNPEFKRNQALNKTEAKNMGLEYVPFWERPEAVEQFNRYGTNGTIVLKVKPGGDLGWVENTVRGGHTPEYSHVANINLAGPFPYAETVTHEGGHTFGMGGPYYNKNLSTKEQIKSAELQQQYLEYKSRQILNPGYDYQRFDLSEHPYEAVQNIRDIGRQLGLSVGQPYPGYDKAVSVLKNTKNLKNKTKQNIASFLKTDEKAMPNVWKALTGTFFSIPILTKPIISKNNREQEKQQKN